MELKKDLLKIDRKSFFRVVLGTGFLVASCGWMMGRVIDEEVIRPFDWFYFGFFALCGIAHVVEGLGLSFERLFGKAYILINPELISLKPGVFDKGQSVYWNNIVSIDYKPNKFIIEKTDNTNVIINLSKFSYSLKNEIKGAIDCIAKEKNLQSNT